MMDPELIRIAQEQMSRISPTELARIQEQMMSNPELVKMAAESMKNMRPEDLRNAAEQLKYARTEDMMDIGSKMANATPEEITTMRARAEAQITYELNAAQMLKKQGNELHSQGRFSDAAEKYLLARDNLKGIPVSKGRALQLPCSLNLMSCYLKTSQFDECIKEGSEVLAYDADNVKALYRRGQAYKGLGQLEDAVSDLNKAHAVSPDDETIADVLRDAKEELEREGEGRQGAGRSVLEEINEEEIRTVRAESHKSSTSIEYSVTQPQEAKASECSQGQSVSNFSGRTTEAECLQGLKDDPEAIRSFQSFISNTDPETLAGLSAGGVAPDMFKSASSMISKMSPEELQKMLGMASSFQGTSPYFPVGTAESRGDSSRSGSLPPGVSPDMLKTATDMMSQMSPDDLQKMFEVASSLRGKDAVSTVTAVDTNGLRSETGSKVSKATEISTVNENSDVGESSCQLHSNTRTGSFPSPNFPTSAVDLQAEMRNQMNDPAMSQMFTSMIKNMSPEMMANMSENFGVKLSQEDAEKAQQAMSSLSPGDLDKMMRWADRIQRGVEGAKKTKNWVLGRPGMILAICILILAIILHRLGFIGS
ncbi:outer envelope protein 61-like [Telopea speciosissima]|uniref:outer envelope protein 61-like n=1 Tax=Telopea speciosissima TaxID=54955 RepID=UPI001CC53C48|nr:outer envelope protein 61-like [Telopea speciosissima]